MKIAVAIIAILALSIFAFAKENAREPKKNCGRVVATDERIAMRPYNGTLDDFHENATPIDIPDGPGGVIESVLNIAESVSITDLNVHVVITHPWVRDLRISLRREGEHDSSSVILLNLFPADSVVNMTNTWFDDEAGAGIYQATVPVEGLFRPLDSLAQYDGENAQGNWILRVEDRFHLDTGRLESWGIDVNHVSALSGTVSLEGGGTAAGVKVQVLWSPFYTITGSNGQWSLAYPGPGMYSVLFSGSIYDSLQINNVSVVEDQTTVLNSTVSSQFESATISYRGDSVTIPDANSASVDLAVSQIGLIYDVDITVSVHHTYVSDLRLTVTSPSGSAVTLATFDCQTEVLGVNMIGCRFDDEATNSIGSADSSDNPFTGSWRPEESLTELDSTQTNGTWTLTVTDQCSLDAGTIQGFTIDLIYIPTVDGGDSPLEIASNFKFHSAYPNPFNSTTTFSFDLNRDASVELLLFDVLGRVAAQVTKETLQAGNHTVRFDATDLASGIYIARLSNGHSYQSQKIILLK